MTEFARPEEGFRFKFDGQKTNDTPDAFPAGKYPMAINVRGTGSDYIRTRPGLTQRFQAGLFAITDMRAYASLETDNNPRILARDTNDGIWLDNATLVGTLAGSGASLSAVFIPFRPNESPNPYLYIANGSDYQKFSAPDINNNVLHFKAGIAEPQTPPDAIAINQYQSYFWEPAGGGPWTNAGTAGAVSNATQRVNDTIAGVFPDPVNAGRTTLQIGSNSTLGGAVTSVTITNGGSYAVLGPNVSFSGGGGSGATGQVTMSGHSFSGGNRVTGVIITNGGTGYTSAPTVVFSGGSGSGAAGTAMIGGGTPNPLTGYQRWMNIVIGGQINQVQDVLPAIPQNLSISGIFYYSGTTGKCVVVPQNMTSGPGNEGESLYAQNLLANLRRGALVTIGSEVCYVLDVIVGPDGTICFETTTVSHHTTSEMLSGVAGIAVLGGGFTVSQAITSIELSFQVTAGLGTVTAPQSFNPFVSSQASFQPEDYVHFSVNIDNLANLAEMKILFDVGDGSFLENFYYYTVRPADILAAVGNTLTQLAAAQIVTQRSVIDQEASVESGGQGYTFSSAQTSPGSTQWSEIVFPISSLTRVGNDQTRSLQNVNSVQMLFNASGTINVLVNSLSVTGGYQPDVGDAGIPYLYRVRPRSSLTGVIGNPSPATRYGVNPRRQQVFVYPPSAAYDAQIDTWDVFRYGGSVTSWRYIGSLPVSSALPFLDNFSDDAANGGDALDFDNFEPWPSIDLPLTPATYGPGNTITANVVGVIAVVSVPGVSTSSRGFPQVANFLPGTLVQIAGQNVYTLWARPTFISGGSGFPSLYLFQFVENAGVQAGVSVTVQEPAVANQHLPYMWGPDANGTVFAVGDPLRPGTVSYCKDYAPDSVPDSYNVEITPSSEPLLGGEIVDGLGLVASSERWWALYPQPDNPAQRYNFVQQPMTRGLAAPSGHCTDGRDLYWWAKDGIYSKLKGSLTDADLYTLFPHEGVPGQNFVYGGQTVFAPDYSRTGTFRLAYANSFLYCIYQNTSGVYCCLVCDMSRGRVAWSVDIYFGLNNTVNSVSTVYHPEQQAGTVQSSTSRYDELLFGTISPSTGVKASVFAQSDLTNDGSTPIFGVLATGEWDGGDLRAPVQWGDIFLDAATASQGSGMIVTPMSLGASVATLAAPVSSANRVRQPLSMGAVVTSDFMGIMLAWEDDFTLQSVPTALYAWQPSFDIQPASTIGFFTFGTSFGLNGYSHIRQIAMAWVSTAPVTIEISTVDGQEPLPVILPSTSGAYNKVLFPVSANKGLLFNFSFTSAQKFQLFLDDSEVYVGQWGRSQGYDVRRALGERTVENAPI